MGMRAQVTGSGDGNFRESFFDVKQEGDAITGEFIQGSRKLPIGDGSYRDGKLHWVVNVRFGNPPQDRQVCRGCAWLMAAVAHARIRLSPDKA